jgi:hypothetical protein
MTETPSEFRIRMTGTPNYRPGQRLRHTGRNSIVRYGYGYEDSGHGPHMSVVLVDDRTDEDNGGEILCETSMLEPAPETAPVPASTLAELADWLDHVRELREHDAGGVIDSIDYKLRTLAGEDLTRTDNLPADGTWPTLQRAIETAEHYAGGGCDVCPAPFDPYARIAELEAERDRAASVERVEIIRSLHAEADKVRRGTRDADSYATLVARIIDLLAGKIDSGSI